jgi:hypothetical protein
MSALPAGGVRDLFDQVGLRESDFIDLNTDRPRDDHIRYLDLVDSGDHVRPDFVVENNGYPILYVVRQDHLGATETDSDQQLNDLMWRLACRADARHLAVVKPGQLAIYPINLSPEIARPIKIDANDASIWLRDFLTGGAELIDSVEKRTSHAKATWLDEFMFELLMQAAHQLREGCADLSAPDILSLIGRALFTRFLADRDIFSETDVSQIAGEAISVECVFDTTNSSASTFRWLDETFNGDLLPLSNSNHNAFFRSKSARTRREICLVLSNVMRRAKGGQIEMDWRAIRFRHVPVDLLSQVYERFFHEFEAATAQNSSVYYTPHHIAQFLLDGTFNALERGERSRARVLDPAVGGGVFLVLALRRLVRERWRETGRRPDRRAIRSILNNQLCGFDINPESLKFAALSLYLTALELDPKPTPLRELRFEDLRGNVLHHVARDRIPNSNDAVLGSLSEGLHEALPQKFRFEFDLVVSNPPWTALSKQYGALLTNKIRSVVQRVDHSLDPNSTLVNPDSVPDLAFVLSAAEWVRQGGAIGFALHSRLLFKQADDAVMRNLIFKIFRFTGVLNAAALRKEKGIWSS